MLFLCYYISIGWIFYFYKSITPHSIFIILKQVNRVYNVSHTSAQCSDAQIHIQIPDT